MRSNGHPDWGELFKLAEGRARVRYGVPASVSSDLAQDAIVAVLSRLEQGEALANVRGVLLTELQHVYFRWKRDPHAVGKGSHLPEDRHPDVAVPESDGLFWHLGHDGRNRGQGFAGAVDDGDSVGQTQHVVLPGEYRQRGRFLKDRCPDCSLWTRRRGRLVRRKGYSAPVFPRWVWEHGSLRLQTTCPSCPPRTLPQGSQTLHRGAPCRVIQPDGEQWVSGSRAQREYAASWVLPCGEFSNGEGTLPEGFPAPWRRPSQILAPTVPRISTPKGHSARMPKKVKAKKADTAPDMRLDRFPRPEVVITDDDLAREAEALRQSRRRRYTRHADSNGLVPAGTVLTCEGCRQARPYQLSCIHTFQAHTKGEQPR